MTIIIHAEGMHLHSTFRTVNTGCSSMYATFSAANSQSRASWEWLSVDTQLRGADMSPALPFSPVIISGWHWAGNNDSQRWHRYGFVCERRVYQTLYGQYDTFMCKCR